MYHFSMNVVLCYVCSLLKSFFYEILQNLNEKGNKFEEQKVKYRINNEMYKFFSIYCSVSWPCKLLDFITCIYIKKIKYFIPFFLVAIVLTLKVIFYLYSVLHNTPLSGVVVRVLALQICVS